MGVAALQHWHTLTAFINVVLDLLQAWTLQVKVASGILTTLNTILDELVWTSMFSSQVLQHYRHTSSSMVMRSCLVDTLCLQLRRRQVVHHFMIRLSDSTCLMTFPAIWVRAWCSHHISRTREVSFNSVASHSHAAATMFWHAAQVTSLWHSLAVNILEYPIGMGEIMSWFQLLPLCSIVGETFPVYRMSTGIASWRGVVMIRCKVRRLNVLSYKGPNRFSRFQWFWFHRIRKGSEGIRFS